MAKRIFQATNLSMGAGTADTTAIASSTYMALRGGSGTQLSDILEVEVAGLSGSSAPCILQLARASTIAITPTALAAPNSDGPAHPSTAALAAPTVSFIAAATGPQRSAVTSDARLNLGLNLFGGIVRWVAAPGAQWSILGNTAPLGESVLSAFTGSIAGAMSGHIVYEPY